jgi:hypothetical protein
VLELLMGDLGFQRRGKRIVERMAYAIKEARRRR